MESASYDVELPSGAIHSPPFVERSRAVALQTCEVRWINRGETSAAMVDWFTRLETVIEDRDDYYLVSPRLPGLSVKVRGSETLDVKANRGRVGSIDLRRAGVAAPVESWEKLSFALDAAPAWPPEASDVSWQRVCKHRRIAILTSPHSSNSPVHAHTCAAELTDFRLDRESWWTLAIEASGDGAHGAIRRAAGRVFAEQPPIGSGFGLDTAASYATWLEGRPGSRVR